MPSQPDSRTCAERVKPQSEKDAACLERAMQEARRIVLLGFAVGVCGFILSFIGLIAAIVFPGLVLQWWTWLALLGSCVLMVCFAMAQARDEYVARRKHQEDNSD